MKSIYTTGTGAKFSLSPLPPYQIEHYRLSFIEQYEADNPRPVKPTYEVETVGGGKELHEHDKTTAVTDEDKAALKAYEDYEKSLDNFVNQKLLDVMIVESVDASPNADELWLSKKKFFGVRLPADPVELKLHYVREHMIMNEEDGGDFAGLPQAIAQLSGISKKAVNAGKATFQRSVRETERDVAGEPEIEIDGEVVDQQPVSGDEDGEIVVFDSE